MKEPCMHRLDEFCGSCNENSPAAQMTVEEYVFWNGPVRSVTTRAHEEDVSAGEDVENPFSEEDLNVIQKSGDAALLTKALMQLRQVSGLLCDKCGWAFKLPGEPCRCELAMQVFRLNLTVEELRFKLRIQTESDKY